MTRTFTSMLIAFATTLCIGCLAIGQPPSADVLLLNGRLFTADPSRPYAEALAIRGDRIVALGTSASIESFAGPRTTRIDVGGRAVIPGINDAHYHLRVEPPALALVFKSRDPMWDEAKAAVA